MAGTIASSANTMVIDDKHTFSSGASSSGKKPRYDLIPTWALERIAHRFQLGAEKHGENNWQKGVGDTQFILDRINHAIEHLYQVKDQIHGGIIATPEMDDDLSGVILNAIFVMGYQREKYMGLYRLQAAVGYASNEKK